MGVLGVGEKADFDFSRAGGEGAGAEVEGWIRGVFLLLVCNYKIHQKSCIFRLAGYNIRVVFLSLRYSRRAHEIQ
ncbi:protein of unknown function [Caballeronia sp. S22]